MNVSQQIILKLPESEIAFVRSFAERNRMSIDDVFDRLVRSLQSATNRKIDPMIQKWAGILPTDTDIDALRLEYLTEKYLGDDRND
jgi:hypothetical protein